MSEKNETVLRKTPLFANLTDHAAADAGKEMAEGTEKGAKVTVYYAEESGRKVAHFFEKV